MKVRIEYVYEPQVNITRAYIWKGMTVIGKHPIQGKITKKQQDIETKRLISKFKDE